MEKIFVVLIAFICGSLPFSVWIGRRWLGRDIRHYGDANPGATNVFRAGSKRLGMFALLLDFLKGAIPVGLAHFALGYNGGWLIATVLAPVLGHAFSPFLGWRGGKAVAVTGGVWCGLTVWEGPTIGGILLGLGVLVFGANGKAVLTAQIGLCAWLSFTPPAWNLLSARPSQLELLTIGAGILLILAWKHRKDF
jgi:glycerol-3-phosphate acyltransferase PlsY